MDADDSSNKYKPLYKAEFTSQHALVNEVYPIEIGQLFVAVKMLMNKQNDGVMLTYTWLATHLPVFQKYLKDFDKLEDELFQIEDLIQHWKSNHINSFPIAIRKKLWYLYKKWWEAYNDSGAGIRGSIYVPRSTRIKKAVQSV